MKIFITGVTGYIGHSLALALATQGHQVNALVRNLTSPLLPRHRNIKFRQGDVTRGASILPAIKDCDYAYHTAALVRFYSKNVSEFYKTNVEGTRNVLDAALQCGTKKLVFTGTCGIMNSPCNDLMTEDDVIEGRLNNHYDKSKFFSEKLVQEYSKNGLSAVIVNLTKVFGPGLETHPVSTNAVIKKFIHGKFNFCPAPKNLISNYVFIHDAVMGHQLAMEKGIPGERYILGGDNISYGEFFDTLRSQNNTGANLIYVSKWLAKSFTALHFFQSKLSGKQPFTTVKAIDSIFYNRKFSSAKAMKQLGYSPRSFKEALLPTIEFLKTKYAHSLYRNMVTT